jgi:hypothetical protein
VWSALRGKENNLCKTLYCTLITVYDFMYHWDLGKLVDHFVILHFISVDFPSWRSRTFHLGYTFTLRIPFHLLRCWCNTCTNMINNYMIHSISSHDHIGSSILTSLAIHHCFSPSALSRHSTCPSTCNQSIEPCNVLIFSPLIRWLNVMSHVQWAPSSHVWALQHLWAIFIVMAYVAHTHVLVD